MITINFKRVLENIKLIQKLIEDLNASKYTTEEEIYQHIQTYIQSKVKSKYGTIEYMEFDDKCNGLLDIQFDCIIFTINCLNTKTVVCKLCSMIELLDIEKEINSIEEIPYRINYDIETEDITIENK